MTAFLACVQHGSMLFSHGLATGNSQRSTRTPSPRSARRFCPSTHSATASAVCHDGPSQMTTKTFFPSRAASLHSHSRNWAVRSPTGRPSANRTATQRLSYR